MLVAHYGLHSRDDLFFLLEDRKTRCLTPGLEVFDETPFEILRPRLACPHSILPATASAVPTDELLRKLSPIPDGGAYWVPPEAKPLIKPLCCPTRPTVFIPWANPIKGLAPELMITNLAPLVIMSYEAKHLIDISRLLELPRVRTIILCGRYRLPGVQPISFGESPEGLSGPSILQAYVNEEYEKCHHGRSDPTRSKTLENSSPTSGG